MYLYGHVKYNRGQYCTNKIWSGQAKSAATTGKRSTEIFQATVDIGGKMNTLEESGDRKAFKQGQPAIECQGEIKLFLMLKALANSSITLANAVSLRSFHKYTFRSLYGNEIPTSLTAGATRAHTGLFVPP